jgi:hypothetical protein
MPPLVEARTIVAAVSVDHVFSASVTRSARVHAGERNEEIVAEAPVPRAVSQWDATA